MSALASAAASEKTTKVTSHPEISAAHQGAANDCDAAHQIVFLESGAGVASLNGQDLSFQAPALLIIPALTRFGLRTDKGSKASKLTISDSFFRVRLLMEPTLGGVFDEALILNAEPQSRTVRTVFLAVQDELERSEVGSEAAIVAHLVFLLVAIMRLGGGAGASASLKSTDIMLVRRLRAEIDAHFASHRPIEAYAKALSVSATRLRGACLRVTGKPATAMIHDRLMFAARQALRTGDRPVSQVAYDLGFEDVAYFSRFFSKKEGASPKQYRDFHRS